MDPNSIRDLIKSTTKPLLIRNLLNWEILQWDLHRWKEILGTQPLQFRQGIYTHTDWPQFENSTKTVQLSFDEFLTFVQETPNKWLYFDYKYLKDWFRNVNELRKHISWDKFGFPERGVEDSTFWLGSKGAHTPMHIDTYGCNIVAQIYGRKRWLLFPSGENLQRTRIPYEESSIYSKINMFSPRGDEFDSVSDCRSITLNPGDVLIVPHRWWHFVENLEIAISINMWVDLPIDNEERVSEAIVQMLVSQFVNSIEPEKRLLIINPQVPLQQNLMEAISLTEVCKKYCKQQEKVASIDCDKIIKKSKYITVVECLSSEQFKEVIADQRKEAAEIKEVVCLNNDQKLLQDYVDSILDEDVIAIIKRKLWKL